jgi:hypothetical protein
VNFLSTFLKKLEFDSSGKVSPEVHVENAVAVEARLCDFLGAFKHLSHFGLKRVALHPVHGTARAFKPAIERGQSLAVR